MYVQKFQPTNHSGLWTTYDYLNPWKVRHFPFCSPRIRQLFGQRWKWMDQLLPKDTRGSRTSERDGTRKKLDGVIQIIMSR